MESSKLSVIKDQLEETKERIHNLNSVIKTLETKLSSPSPTQFLSDEELKKRAIEYMTKKHYDRVLLI